MQKSEGAVIHMNKNEIHYLAGSEKLQIRTLPIYSDVVCEFLDSLSKDIRNDAEARQYPDILTFAFWCRKANIVRLKESYHTLQNRVGRGLVFHIAPSNVPINFAFSLVFGMLAGNANVVRVSEKDFPQTKIVCRILQKLWKKPEYEMLGRQTQVVSYGHVKEINDYYSAKCSMRVIWGGDATIEEVRRSPLPARATEITFADRYSFAIFDEKAIGALNEKEIMQVAEKFYNDTYLMDQNACSSPHLILWQQPDGKGRESFWKALAKVAEKYDLPEKKVLDKYTILCEKAAQMDEIQGLEKYTNVLYVAKLFQLPENMENLRGKFGLFYEADLESLLDVCGKITEKMQTCVTYGMDNRELAKVFMEYGVSGVDRIVNVGEAMDIGTFWDGYDVIGSLSRGIVVEN